MNGQALTLVAGVTGLEPAIFPSSLTGRSNEKLQEKMAGVTGLEPAIFPSSLTGRSNEKLQEKMAGVTGLEPATSGLTGRRSNQS
jgi:hypothetical protein